VKHKNRKIELKLTLNACVSGEEEQNKTMVEEAVAVEEERRNVVKL
jgi:hypothetical protein